MRPRVMTRGALLRTIDSARIEEAIRQAERRTSGEIRVSVSRFFWGDVRRVAERAFTRLGLTATRERNGVLFFIVPSRRRFVVLGDEGIHARVGQEFWDSVAEAVAEHLRDGDFTLGLVHGIERVGEQLALHFPFDPATDTNELSDAVDFGGKRPQGRGYGAGEAATATVGTGDGLAAAPGRWTTPLSTVWPVRLIAWKNRSSKQNTEKVIDTVKDAVK